MAPILDHDDRGRASSETMAVIDSNSLARDAGGKPGPTPDQVRGRLFPHPALDARDVEADLAALKLAAERARVALACLFSSSDEFEAAIIRERREQGRLPRAPAPRPIWRRLTWVVVAALVLLVL